LAGRDIEWRGLGIILAAARNVVTGRRRDLHKLVRLGIFRRRLPWRCLVDGRRRRVERIVFFGQRFNLQVRSKLCTYYIMMNGLLVALTRVA
jgi:hypothetical protein